MKKYVKFLLVVLATMLPACCTFNNVRHPEPTLTLPEVLERKTVALVRWVVKEVDEDGDESYKEVDPETEQDAEMVPFCAGVWVSNDVILTAAHCVSDIGRPPETPVDRVLRMLTGGKKPYWDPTGQNVSYSTFGDVDDKDDKKFRTARKAIVLAYDDDHDLALVRGGSDDLPSHSVAKLSVDSARVGDEIHIVGHPSGMWWTYIHGWVSQIRPNSLNADEKKVNVMQVSAPVWFGNSGGGVFDEHGKLIGVMSWIRRIPNVGFAVDSKTIESFLSKNDVKN